MSIQNSAARFRVPAFEALELRRLLSAGLAGGVLTINGTAGSDTIYVSLNFQDATKVLVRASTGSDQNFALASVKSIVINGGLGDDHIQVINDNGFVLPLAIRCKGGGGNDFIQGGNSNDTLFGGEGDDELRGGRGNDDLSGDAGNDKIIAGFGDDIVYGGADSDTIQGQGGRDQLKGGTGNDSIDGGNGNDLIFGNDGDDDLDGGEGNDQVFGQQGNDDFVGKDAPIELLDKAAADKGANLLE